MHKMRQVSKVNSEENAKQSLGVHNVHDCNHILLRMDATFVIPLFKICYYFYLKRAEITSLSGHFLPFHS